MSDPSRRREYLERLIMGLEQSIENQKFEIPYYKEGDLQLVYAKKFLAAMEQQLKDARKELAELEAKEQDGPAQAKPPFYE